MATSDKVPSKLVRTTVVGAATEHVPQKKVTYKRIAETDLTKKLAKSLTDTKRKGRGQDRVGGMYILRSKSSTTSKFEAGKPTNSPRRIDASDLRKMADVLSRKAA